VENGFGIVRGHGYAFFLKAPEGWVIDATSGVDQGLPAVFYPKGSSCSESPAVAYARARSRTKSVSGVEETVKAAVQALRAQGNPDYSAKLLKTIRTSDGKEGAVYRFSGAKTGDIEATVYFVEKRTIDFVTLSCRSKRSLNHPCPPSSNSLPPTNSSPTRFPSIPTSRDSFRMALRRISQTTNSAQSCGR